MPRKISSFLAVHTGLYLVPILVSQRSCNHVLAKSSVRSSVVFAI